MLFHELKPGQVFSFNLSGINAVAMKLAGDNEWNIVSIPSYFLGRVSDGIEVFVNYYVEQYQYTDGWVRISDEFSSPELAACACTDKRKMFRLVEVLTDKNVALLGFHRDDNKWDFSR